MTTTFIVGAGKTLGEDLEFGLEAVDVGLGMWDVDLVVGWRSQGMGK